jgi:hypothetical protein
VSQSDWEMRSHVLRPWTAVKLKGPWMYVLEWVRLSHWQNGTSLHFKAWPSEVSCVVEEEVGGGVVMLPSEWYCYQYRWLVELSLCRGQPCVKTRIKEWCAWGPRQCLSGSIQNWFHYGEWTNSTACDEVYFGTFETFDDQELPRFLGDFLNLGQQEQL